MAHAAARRSSASSTNPRFFSTVFELDFGGERLKVLPREAQLHPVTDDPLHVDFLRAEAGAVIHVDVPVRFVHEDQSPGPQARRRAQHRPPRRSS